MSTEDTLQLTLYPELPTTVLVKAPDEKLDVSLEGHQWRDMVDTMTVTRAHNVRGVFVCVCSDQPVDEIYQVILEDEPMDPEKEE